MGSCVSSSRRAAAAGGGRCCGSKTKKKGRSSGGGRRSSGGDEAEEEAALHGVPGRMFVNGSSETACLFTQQGRKGNNQDAMLVWENFASRSDTIFCGVFDGHGPYGHMVAKKVRDSLPVKLCKQWRADANESNSAYQNTSANGSMNSEETASMSFDDEWGEHIDVDQNEQLPEIYPSLKQSFLKAFKLMDKELNFHPIIDCFCSGTTAVTVVKQGQHLVIGNVGDSRAVLGTLDKENNLVALQLTIDLKPSLPREAARIHKCKGRVFALLDEPEVPRVWLPNNDSPGLAMARAFGDFCLKDYGLISVPDIFYHCLSERDKFIVLATDGVWDVLSNKEVVDIVAAAPTHRTAARALVDCAVRSWRLKFPTSKIDDCAVVCLFLDSSSSYQAPETTPKTAAIHRDETSDLSLADQETHLKSGEHEPENHDALSMHPNVVYNDDEIVSLSNETELGRAPDSCLSTRSLADCMSATEEEEWSALEGVTRVNSLVALPRFSSSPFKRSSSWKKWL